LYRTVSGVLAVELTAAIIALGLIATFLPPIVVLEWLARTLPAGSGRPVPWGLPIGTGALGAISTYLLLPRALRLPGALWRQAKSGLPEPVR
jgi:hypothetical protein